VNYRSSRSTKHKTLELFGPEHEFSIVDDHLKPLPIVDVIIKKLCGRIKNSITLSNFVFGKELQKHVAEFKGSTPFQSPICFEKTLYNAILQLSDILDNFGASLLGTGMHPTLCINEAKVWDHRDRHIYHALHQLFNLRQHGWLNIQSFQLNLSYFNEKEAVKLYNHLINVLPYLPAITAASPIFNSDFGEFVDNRLHFYGLNQKQIPSIAGDIIPTPIDSFKVYKKKTIVKYSLDLVKANAPACIVNKEWINSRGAIFRFDRKAIEIRLMDEQECIKADVALSCFIRALLRGLLHSKVVSLPHSLLLKDFYTVKKKGLNAKVHHPHSSSARGVCRYLLKIAYEHASKEERSYLWIVKKRIDEGNLSEIITKHVKKRMQKTTLPEAILSVYSTLITKLKKNEVFA
jgi:gamma-glutamyl:cysteine ligase YbdK (ATP-grasp superfamily)